MKGLKALRWSLLVSGVLLIVVGVWTLFTPWSSLISLAMLISIALLLSGAAEIAVFFGGRGRVQSGWLLAGGILSAVIGLWLLIGRGYEGLAVALPFVFGVWVLCSGITRAVGSFELKSAQVEGWVWELVIGIIEVLAGALLLFSPVLSATMSSLVVSLSFLSHGVSDVLMFSNMTRAKRFVQHVFDER